MTFLWREALWLLLLTPALITAYFALVRRKRPSVRYPNLFLVREAARGSPRLRRHLPPLLLLLGLLLLVFALARPAAVITLPSEQRTIVLAIDVSLSMAATDVAPTRIQAAQSAAQNFIRAQPADVRVGVVAFAGSADLVQPPTTNRAEALSAIENLRLDYNTSIGGGVLAALLTIFPDTNLGADYDIFGLGRSPVPPQRAARTRRYELPPKLPALPAGSFRSAAVILLTDGRDTMGFPAMLAARLAAERGIRVFTVGFGRTEPTSMTVDGQQVDASLDEAVLKNLAQATRGHYFHASTAEELHNVYRTLSGHVVLERKERELAAVFTALAALLSLTAAALSLTWSGRFA